MPPREISSSSSSTPPAVLWSGYAVILGGLAAIALQVLGPILPPGPSGERADATPGTATAPPIGEKPRPEPAMQQSAALAPATGAATVEGRIAEEPRPEPATAAQVLPPPTPEVAVARPAPPAPEATPPAETSLDPARPPPARAALPEPTAAPAGDIRQPQGANARNLVRGNTALRQIVVSFDGGSGANSAAPILEALDRSGVHTTFFLTGEFIRHHPDVTREIVRRGHEVGNHTDGHVHLTRWEEEHRHTTRIGVDRTFLAAELAAAEASFRAITGGSMAPLWRAPYGELNPEVLAWAADEGYRHVGWTRGLDSLDWVADRRSPRYRTAEEFLQVLSERLKAERLNGGILLFHLDSRRPEPERFGNHIASIINLLLDAGYEIVPASIMLGNLDLERRAEGAR